MERRLHLPKWVADKFSRQQRDEERARADAIQKMMDAAVRVSEAAKKNKPQPEGMFYARRATKPTFKRDEARRRAKRARMSRRGQSVHNFRIHT